VAKGKETDQRVTNFEFDVEVDRKAREKLGELGISKGEDLQPGRADLTKTAEVLKGIDPEIDPFIASKAIRDKEFRDMAGGVEQPSVVEEPIQAEVQPPAPDRLAQLQAEAEAAKAEADDWKRKYGERENRLGEERRRTAERLARLEQGVGSMPPQQPTGYTPAQVAGTYDPRILGNRDPDTPMTAMAAAFGQQMTAREAQLLETTKQLRNYDLTPDEEVTLIEKHPWLANVDRSAQLTAMRDLVEPLRNQAKPSGVGVPAAPAMPQRQNMEQLARARHITATTHIEPSTQGSPSEFSASGEDNSSLAKKAARLKELLDTPGASTDPKLGPETERLMNELSGRRR
jgi:hypothetical protein